MEVPTACLPTTYSHNLLLYPPQPLIIQRVPYHNLTTTPSYAISYLLLCIQSSPH